jgi:hypothetical protein
MPENGRSPTDEGRGGDKPNDPTPIAAGGEAITATLTGAVEKVSKDVREAGNRVADASTDAIDDAGHVVSQLSEEPVEAVAEADGETPSAGNGSVAIVRGTERPVRSRLRDAMRRARQNDAERNDVIVDLRETEIARLEVLAENVQDVFDDLPDTTDLFDGQVSQSNPPRLWIDVLAYVVMGRDKRTYQFVQETRQGRKVVRETTSVDQMGEQITNYVAHRMIERERALLSEPEPITEPSADRHTDVGNGAKTQNEKADGPEPSTDSQSATPDAAKASAPESTVPRYSGLALIVSFLLGMVAGAITLFLIGANYTPPA